MYKLQSNRCNLVWNSISWCGGPCCLNHFTLKMEAARSSETWCRHIPEDLESSSPWSLRPRIRTWAVQSVIRCPIRKQTIQLWVAKA